MSGAHTSLLIIRCGHPYRGDDEVLELGNLRCKRIKTSIVWYTKGAGTDAGGTYTSQRVERVRDAAGKVTGTRMRTVKHPANASMAYQLMKAQLLQHDCAERRPRLVVKRNKSSDNIARDARREVKAEVQNKRLAELKNEK